MLLKKRASASSLVSSQVEVCDMSIHRKIGEIFPYYALRCHLKLIDSGSASLSMGHSIEAHHRNYPYSKESTTTNAFKLARARSVA